MAHTPTPWTVGRIDGQTVEINSGPDPSLGYSHWEGLAEVRGCDQDPHVGRDVMLANAEFIVRAVNAHEELVAAVRNCREFLMEESLVEHYDGMAHPLWLQALDAVEAAIAKAEGR